MACNGWYSSDCEGIRCMVCFLLFYYAWQWPPCHGRLYSAERSQLNSSSTIPPESTKCTPWQYTILWYPTSSPHSCWKKINHMVVQCGEHHVVPLSKILSEYLIGRITALFSPNWRSIRWRLMILKKCFLKHNTYIKTLRFVSLPPALTNLDLVCTEYLESGEVLERTTRAWAGSLLSPDGSTSARCDTVNGGTDKRTSLSSGPSFPSSLHSGSSLSLPTPTQSYWQARSTISRKVSQAFLKWSISTSPLNRILISYPPWLLKLSGNKLRPLSNHHCLLGKSILLIHRLLYLLFLSNQHPRCGFGWSDHFHSVRHDTIGYVQQPSLSRIGSHDEKATSRNFRLLPTIQLQIPRARSSTAMPVGPTSSISWT